MYKRQFLGNLLAALQAPEKLLNERVKRYKERPKRAKKPRKADRYGRVRKVKPPKPPSAKAMAALMKEVAALDLAARVAMECARMELIIDGVLAIQAGANPRVVEEMLLSFLPPAERLAAKENRRAA